MLKFLIALFHNKYEILATSLWNKKLKTLINFNINAHIHIIIEMFHNIIKERFIAICERTFDLPKDMKEEDYEYFFTIMTFTADCDVPISEDEMWNAYTKYQEFAFHYSLKKAVDFGCLDYVYNGDTKEYEYKLSEKGQLFTDSANSSLPNTDAHVDKTTENYVKHDQYINSYIDQYIKEYIDIVNQTKQNERNKQDEKNARKNKRKVKNEKQIKRSKRKLI